MSDQHSQLWKRNCQTTCSGAVLLTARTDLTTTFIGKNGATLKTDNTTTPTYTLPEAGQFYVRAKTNGPNGSAWTQPVYDKSYIADYAGSGFPASANWTSGTARADKYKTSYHYRSTLNGSPDCMAQNRGL